MRRSILDWRDRNTLEAELSLQNSLPCLLKRLDELIDGMSFTDFVVNQKKFGKEKIQPVFKKWVEEEVKIIIQQAQAELQKIFEHELQYELEKFSMDEVSTSKHYLDSAEVAAITAAAVASVPLFASISTVSAGGLLGLLGVTTVSLPILSAGVIVFGFLLALGGFRATRIKSRARSRYKKRVEQAITQQIISQDRSTLSIADSVKKNIAQVARNILKEIDA